MALARAQYRVNNAHNIDMVVLDEPTSALDPMIEHEIFNYFKRLTTHKIGIIVSHRLAMAKFSDEIILISEGKIIEQGNHQDLMAQRGAYYEMFNKQSKAYNKE